MRLVKACDALDPGSANGVCEEDPVQRALFAEVIEEARELLWRELSSDATRQCQRGSLQALLQEIVFARIVEIERRATHIGLVGDLASRQGLITAREHQFNEC